VMYSYEKLSLLLFLKAHKNSFISLITSYHKNYLISNSL
jgi:hypothetical protein